MSVTAETAQNILSDLPLEYKGPGGCAAILQDGELISQQVWGYADIDQRIPMTAQTLMPVCSITKQLLCRLMVDLAENPTPTIQGDFWEQITTKLYELLPGGVTREKHLTVDLLCDMCSGLRDYWALGTLQGNRPESSYSIEKDNPAMLSSLGSFHFEPDTEFSYCNTNFNILGRLVEQVTGGSLEELLKERVFDKAEMTTARLCPRTDRLPPPCVPYEGTIESGFIKAFNYIEWAGDAGVVASLADMIAYERFFDERYSNQQDTYREAIQPRKYKDGTLRQYRYGLSYYDVNGIETVGHGGALRGYRIHRRYAIDQRVSVVVMFNHEANAQDAADCVLARLLGSSEPATASPEPSSEWFGTFFDQDTQLALTVSPTKTKGEIKINYAEPVTLRLVDASNAKSRSMLATIEGDILRVNCLEDNRRLVGERIVVADNATSVDVQGTYHCDEISSTLRIEGEGRVVYGSFDGAMGKGPVHIVTRVGDNIWFLADPRGMDAPGPGNWTLVFHSDSQGKIVGVTVGCWLARKLEYKRV